MTSPEHSPEILDKIDSLLLFQRNGYDVLISMDDPDLQARLHYSGSVLGINDEPVAPSASILVSRFTISYLSSAHRQAAELFNSLREAREAVLTDSPATSKLQSDIELMGSIEAELGVEHDEHTLEFPEGLIQQIAISSMRNIMGVSRSI